MANINGSIRKLIQALNVKGDRLLYSQKQFMGTEGKVHPLYCLSRAVWDDERGKFKNTELYSTTSNIRMCLYLRDMLCIADGEELPTDNAMWNEIREKIKHG